MNIFQDTEGFTLIEVLVAMVVLSIGIFALYSMQVTSIKGNAKANVISESANVVRDKIEQFLATDYYDPVFNAGSSNPAVTVGSSIQSISMTVADWSSDGLDNDLDGPPADEFDERGVKDIQLIIQYTDMGVAKSTTVNFLKTEIF